MRSFGGVSATVAGVTHAVSGWRIHLLHDKVAVWARMAGVNVLELYADSLPPEMWQGFFCCATLTDGTCRTRLIARDGTHNGIFNLQDEDLARGCFNKEASGGEWVVLWG